MAILLELQARGFARAEDLAEHFEVSVRTMYRDLDAISESGVPLAISKCPLKLTSCPAATTAAASSA